MSTKKRKNITCYFKCSTSPLLWILLKCPHWAAKNDMLDGRWWTGMWTLFFPNWNCSDTWAALVISPPCLSPQGRPDPKSEKVCINVWNLIRKNDLLQNPRRFALKDEIWFGRMIFSHTWSKLPPSTTPLDFLIGKLLLLPFSIVIRGLVGGQEVRSLKLSFMLSQFQLSNLSPGVFCVFTFQTERVQSSLLHFRF